MILSKLVEYMKANKGPHKTAAMAKAVGANKNTCRRMMGELRQLGVAEVVGKYGVERLWQYVEPEPRVIIKEVIKTVEKPVIREKVVTKEVVKVKKVEVEVPGPIRYVEKPTGYVMLQSAGEGETTPESLKAQHEYIMRYLRAKREHYDKRRATKTARESI